MWHDITTSAHLKIKPMTFVELLGYKPGLNGLKITHYEHLFSSVKVSRANTSCWGEGFHTCVTQILTKSQFFSFP
jgi:hypothetical protein